MKASSFKNEIYKIFAQNWGKSFVALQISFQTPAKTEKSTEPRLGARSTVHGMEEVIAVFPSRQANFKISLTSVETSIRTSTSRLAFQLMMLKLKSISSLNFHWLFNWWCNCIKFFKNSHHCPFFETCISFFHFMEVYCRKQSVNINKQMSHFILF